MFGKSVKARVAALEEYVFGARPTCNCCDGKFTPWKSIDVTYHSWVGDNQLTITWVLEERTTPNLGNTCPFCIRRALDAPTKKYKVRT